jgi:hypothetical protein
MSAGRLNALRNHVVPVRLRKSRNGEEPIGAVTQGLPQQESNQPRWIPAPPRARVWAAGIQLVHALNTSEASDKADDLEQQLNSYSRQR